MTFADGLNAAGIQQNACVLCGDCCLGCNYGAKNTVLMDYLPDAHAHGAQIFTEVAVRSVQRWQGTWRVVFDVLGAGRGLYAASFGSPGRHGASSARRLREVAEIPLGPYHGPVDRTLTYLVMSTDDSGGRLVLENDRIQVTWPEVAEQPVFARDNRILTMATKALHGTPVPDPLWAWTNGRSLITVHPLGGCVMADEAAAGVVDHKGRVFTGDGNCDTRSHVVSERVEEVRPMPKT